MTTAARCGILMAVPGGTLKGIVAACALLCSLLLAGPATAAAPAANPLETSVLAQVNTFRARNGLAPLRLSARLSAAASSHSSSMAQRGFFTHRSADGSSWWRRLGRFYRPRGYREWSVGENLLWSARRVDGAAALRMWLRSRPHRRNLLTPRWREIGLSAVHVAAAPGFFGGRTVTIVTADFGVRR
jgi:uncharacterized protein YkwD